MVYVKRCPAEFMWFTAASWIVRKVFIVDGLQQPLIITQTSIFRCLEGFPLTDLFFHVGGTGANDSNFFRR